MVLPRLGGSEALHACHIENDRVVYHAIDCSKRGHRVFEDARPGGKHQVGGNQDGTLLVALGQQRKEHLHLVAILLDIANIVQDQAAYLLKLRNLLRQTQFALGSQQSLHQRGGGTPQDRVTLLDELVA